MFVHCMQLTGKKFIGAFPGSIKEELIYKILTNNLPHEVEQNPRFDARALSIATLGQLGDTMEVSEEDVMNQCVTYAEVLRRHSRKLPLVMFCDSMDLLSGLISLGDDVKPDEKVMEKFERTVTEKS